MLRWSAASRSPFHSCARYRKEPNTRVTSSEELAPSLPSSYLEASESVFPPKP